MASVKRFMCPEVSVPTKINKTLKPNDISDNSPQRNDNRFNNRLQEKTAERKEFSNIFNSIKELASTQYVGMNKKKFKEDKLTKLGAAPVKQQKMPFKMKIGIVKGREKKMKKIQEQAKESGVVLSKNLLEQSKKIKKNNMSNQPNLDVRTKSGVLHINKKRIKS